MSYILATTSGLQTYSDSSSVLYLQTGASANSMTINASGAVGFGTTPSYGTVNQVLVSGGSGAPPQWTTPSFTTTGKVIATAIVF